MRKVISATLLVLGALGGLLLAAEDDWGTRIAMMGIALIFAGPLAVAVLRHKRESGVRRTWKPPVFGGLTGESTSADDLAANYWRDKGHPPFMKPQEGHPDKHQFDPDRIF